MHTIKHDDCVAFLKWALPRLGLGWSGYRKVHRTVCKRLRHRVATLGLPDLRAYRHYLSDAPAEWSHLAALCRIPISRFHRDKAVLDLLADTVLPYLAGSTRDEGRDGFWAWSAGCASGEEPYSLALVWAFAVAPGFPGPEFRVLASDAEAGMLARARRACYPIASLRDLPEPWRDRAFSAADHELCLRPAFARNVHLIRHDVTDPPPALGLDLVCCRNLAFTYFDRERRLDVLEHLRTALRPGGCLVIGNKEALPDGPNDFVPVTAKRPLYWFRPRR